MSTTCATSSGAFDEKARHRAWCWLALAVLAEICGTLALRESLGFTVITYACAALAAFAFALVLVSRVMRVLPLGVAYPVWAGGGTAGAAAAGVALFGEPLSPLRVLGVVLVIVGVVAINQSRESGGGC